MEFSEPLNPDDYEVDINGTGYRFLDRNERTKMGTLWVVRNGETIALVRQIDLR
jgi:hypothetical protein